MLLTELFIMRTPARTQDVPWWCWTENTKWPTLHFRTMHKGKSKYSTTKGDINWDQSLSSHQRRQSSV